jgi:hypothetical protein
MGIAMKWIRAFSLGAVGAGALVALVGAGAASAAQLCAFAGTGAECGGIGKFE